MPLNPFFLQGSASEQRLVQDLINEQLKIYGVEVFYMPRKFVGTDDVIKENIVARFDDSFNINCVGDKFSSLGVSTILFEAGHYQDDYSRNITRKHMLSTLIHVLKSIIQNNHKAYSINDYLSIPENNMDYCDLLIKGVDINDNQSTYINQDLVINYKEILKNSNIDFVPKFIGYSDSYVGLAHKTVDFKNLEISGPIKFKLNYLSAKMKHITDKLLNM